MNTIPPLPALPSPIPRPWHKYWAIRIAALLAIAMTLWFFFGHTKSSSNSGTPPVAVKVATATIQQVPVNIQVVGNVVAYESVGVRARLDSQITAVHFKDGDEVKQGDLLFELDDKSLRARAAELAANITRDRAQLENARRQSARAKTLADKGFATKATRDDSAANEQVAQASLSASIAALESVKVELSYTRITAPISGRTGTINVTLGNNVKANDAAQPLVTINQLKPIRVQASLPQQHFDALRAAMQTGTVNVVATPRGDTNADAPVGTLDYIDNAVDAATGTFVTRAGFANEDERLLPGMFVTATMTLGGDTQAITVPEVAIQHGQASDYVFIIAGGKAMRHEVKVARLQNNLAVIESGLEAGSVVAVDGLLSLKDGSTVKVMADTPAAPEPVK